MACELCGVETQNGWNDEPLKICQSCSEKAQIDGTSKKTVTKFKYHTAIKVHYFLAALCIFILACLAVIKTTTQVELENINIYTFGTFLAFAAFHYAVAQKLKVESTISVFASLLSGALLLLFIPIGTVIGIILIYSFIRSWK